MPIKDTKQIYHRARFANLVKSPTDFGENVMEFNTCGSFWACGFGRTKRRRLRSPENTSRKTAALTREWILVSSQIPFGLYISPNNSKIIDALASDSTHGSPDQTNLT